MALPSAAQHCVPRRQRAWWRYESCRHQHGTRQRCSCWATLCRVCSTTLGRLLPDHPSKLKRSRRRADPRTAGAGCTSSKMEGIHRMGLSTHRPTGPVKLSAALLARRAFNRVGLLSRLPKELLSFRGFLWGIKGHTYVPFHSWGSMKPSSTPPTYLQREKMEGRRRRIGDTKRAEG